MTPSDSESHEYGAQIPGFRSASLALVELVNFWVK